MASDGAEIWSQDEYHFHGQRPDEHVMQLKHMHLSVLSRPLMWVAVSLFIPVLTLLFTHGGFRFYTVLVYVLLAAFYVGNLVYGYMNSVYVLTDQRILNVDQRGFFHCQISEAELARIQDVSTEIKGVLQTLFHYGDVTIRTASKDSTLVLESIGDPYDVQQAIVRALKSVQSQ